MTTTFPNLYAETRLIAGHPTQLVASWDLSSRSPALPYVVVIPGNPGIISLYKPFVDRLSKRAKDKANVVSMSYCSQDPNDLTSDQKKVQTKSASDMKEQIEHKLAVMNHVIPAGADVTIIAHSLGCYITLQLLNSDRLEKYRVRNVAFLCPVIGQMHESQTGQWFGPMVKNHPYLARALIYGFTSIPRFLLWRMISSKLEEIFHPPESYRHFTFDAIVTFLKAGRRGIVNAMTLGEEAIDLLRAYRVDDLLRHKDRVVVFYTPSDHWVPKGMYENILEEYPDMKICAVKCAHAFNLHYSEEMVEELDEFLTDAIEENE